MNPLPANRALEQFFLDARCRLLDLAAILDRINRGEQSDAISSDPRIEKIARALEILRSTSSNKAELIQQTFSLDYDPDWKRPQPRF